MTNFKFETGDILKFKYDSERHYLVVEDSKHHIKVIDLSRNFNTIFREMDYRLLEKVA